MSGLPKGVLPAIRSASVPACHHRSWTVLCYWSQRRIWWRVARRASWVASGAGRRARAALSCAWSMTRGSGAVTGTGRPGSVAGFGAAVGVGSGGLSPPWVRVARFSSRRRPRCWLRRVPPQAPWCRWWHSWGRAKQRAKWVARLRRFLTGRLSRTIRSTSRAACSATCQPNRRARSDPTQLASGPAQDPEVALVS